MNSKSTTLSLLAGLAPLALYYGFEAWWTKTAALLIMLAWMAGEFAFYRWRRWPITPLFLFANFVTLGFVAEDLWLERSHATIWEPVLTNGMMVTACLVAAFFLPALLHEVFAQAQRSAPDKGTLSFLRMIIAAWALFFTFSAGVGLYLAVTPNAPGWTHHLIGYGPAALWALCCLVWARPLHRKLQRGAILR